MPAYEKNFYIAICGCIGRVKVLSVKKHMYKRILIMKEIDKMRNHQMYRFDDGDVLASVAHANALCAKLQTMTAYDDSYREIIEELIPGIPLSSCVTPPFHCDHGHCILIGENVFVNYNATFLDGGGIRIGNRTKIGPNCQLMTPNHPIDYLERRKSVEMCMPIVIGNDCWLGDGVIVCPNVTIGDRCVIGAGSVVVHDIPADSLAVGNPCRVIRKLDK